MQMIKYTYILCGDKVFDIYWCGYVTPKPKSQVYI